MECIRCGSEATRKDGQTQLGGQRWRCNHCGRRFTTRSTSSFSHHAFPDDVIALAVRWYVRYRLSYADVVEWLAERGVTVDRRLDLSLGATFPPVVPDGCSGPPTPGRHAMAHRRNLCPP